MLQQTQAPRVIPKWRAFCAAYPTPAACAAAPLGDVLRLWQGLGYPRRARNLHGPRSRSRRLTTARFPPSSRRCWRCRASGRTRLGPCSRSRSSATWRVVDTNIARVLARTAGERLDGTRRPATRRWLRAARARLGVEPDAHGPRRIRVPADAAVRRLSAGRDVRLEWCRTAATRPGRRIGRRQHAPGAVRRLRPRGPWSSSCARLTSGPARARRVPRRHRRLAPRRRPRDRRCRHPHPPVSVNLWAAPWSPKSAITAACEMARALVRVVIAATISSKAASA